MVNRVGNDFYLLNRMQNYEFERVKKIIIRFQTILNFKMVQFFSLSVSVVMILFYVLEI